MSPPPAGEAGAGTDRRKDPSREPAMTKHAGAAEGSRRSLLQVGLRRAALLAGAAGAGGWLAGCGSSPLRSHPRHVAPSQAARNAEVLNGLLDLVHPSIAAYTAGTPLLSGMLRQTAGLFLSEELVHAGRLIALVRRFHGKPHRRAPHYDLGDPRSEREALQLFHRLEGREAAAYLQALPKVSQDIRPDLASILGNNAQHLTILRRALGVAPVPSAFLLGGE